MAFVQTRYAPKNKKNQLKIGEREHILQGLFDPCLQNIVTQDHLLTRVSKQLI